MKIGVLLIALSFLLISCSRTPHHVELDDFSKERKVSKYGEGTYYFIYTYHTFSSKNDTEGQEVYFRDIEKYIDLYLENSNTCKPIKETLSYYSEGGSVSILVLCKST
ncbi:hypothetical protein ACJJIP_04725 [Microbulbifer sp. VTAC004]|uniref:hypothetical protein n=1 Tax=unclassified Microbulbifer TaxID=2619833 RepID=UPI00403A0AE8